jgi:hypothetical protein
LGGVVYSRLSGKRHRHPYGILPFVPVDIIEELP